MVVCQLGAKALVQLAFLVPGVDRVIASTMAVNMRSRRVLSKVGLRYVQTRFGDWDDPLPSAELGEVVHVVEREGCSPGDRTQSCREAARSWNIGANMWRRYSRLSAAA